MTTPNFDEIAKTIADLPYGLVVINGPKGSGKSTLLNRVEAILGEGDLFDNFKFARAGDCSVGGKFQVIDVSEAVNPAYEAALHTSVQQTFRFLMRWYGYRTFAIEDIETMGLNTTFFIDNAINLALTGTLVIVTIDSLSTPEGRNVMESIERQKYLGLEPVWVNLT